MDGVIIIDKPAGWTSHDVVAKLRGAMHEKRIGHSGTLDPIATGVLPVFAGRATKAVELFGNDEKEYVAGLRLGVVTDTQDAAGNVLQSRQVSFNIGDIAAATERFLGAQQQVPPMYSAVKIGGKKLYELARRGMEVSRPAREIVISEIEVLGGDGAEFLLRVVCSKGTYIRTLCNDIGEMLGCGGSMSSLRRTRAGEFTIDLAHALDAVLDAVESGRAGDIMIPIDMLFAEYPEIVLCAADAGKCRNGAQCRLDGVADGIYRVYGPDNEFMLLGETKNGDIAAIKRFHR
ncbi:MAG: tRNA pseudouridine(55) synthase TruB [Oscillospiraceae bacterium]|nr:tRNA pseudouridine(55) synthase TruB [Oscillospiraceae bacterium]